MGFFKSKPQPEANPGTTTSTATWQSIASGDSATYHSQQQQPTNDDHNNDGSGFLHPESSLQSNRALTTSEWSKERSSQQLELEDDIHNNRNNSGCCYKIIEFLVKALHIVNAIMGIALVVYGSLLYTQFDPPAMAAVTFCLIFGSLHILTSFVGILSFFTRGCCSSSSRFGMIVSAYVGPYFALVYFTMLIALVVDSSGFLQYLGDHKEVSIFLFMLLCVKCIIIL
ncbi:hypothetical protein ACHAXR_004763 [Thalassiosira sp. AJA248-18]